MHLLESTWKDVETYLKKKKSIIIPLASIEQHGLALPLGTDYYIIEKIASEVGKRSSTLVLPCIIPGLSLIPHMAFSGTVSLKPETLQKVIEDIITSLCKHGFRQFLLMNGNRLNDNSITSAIQNLCYSFKGIRINSRSWWELKKVQSLRKVYFSGAGHASPEEVSMIMYIQENLVKKDLFRKHIAPYNYITSLEKVKDYTYDGLISGDQSEADPDLGRQMFEEAVKGYISILKDLIE